METTTCTTCAEKNASYEAYKQNLTIDQLTDLYDGVYADMDTLGSMLQIASDDPESFQCDHCHYDSDEIDHKKCKGEIIVFPGGYQEYIACRCDCNKSNWESKEQIDQVLKDELLEAISDSESQE